MDAQKKNYNHKTDREAYTAKAKELVRQGFTKTRIASELGVSRHTIAMLLDDAAYKRHLERGRNYDQYDRVRVKGETNADRYPTDRLDKDHVKSLIDAIPSDTRSKTGVLMGGPLPGRSSLDKLHQCEVIPLRRAS